MSHWYWVCPTCPTRPPSPWNKPAHPAGWWTCAGSPVLLEMAIELHELDTHDIRPGRAA